LCQMRNFDN